MWLFRPTESGYAQSRVNQIGAGIVGVGASVVAAVALVAAATVEPIVDGVRAVAMAGTAVLMVRLAMGRVEVLEDGVRVVNPWKTSFVPWSRFKGFTRKRWLLVYPRVPFVSRTGGRPIPIVVLIAGGWFVGGDHTAVDDAVAQLALRAGALRARRQSGEGVAH